MMHPERQLGGPLLLPRRTYHKGAPPPRQQVEEQGWLVVICMPSAGKANSLLS